MSTSQKFLALILFSLSSLLPAQGQLPQTSKSAFTGGLLNGRAWETFPAAVKSMYVAGIKDSILAAAMASDSAPNKIAWAEHFTVDDYVKELNLLYVDRENIRIPVVFGVRYLTQKFRGDRTKADLESGLMALREWMAELK